MMNWWDSCVLSIRITQWWIYVRYEEKKKSNNSRKKKKKSFVLLLQMRVCILGMTSPRRTAPRYTLPGFLFYDLINASCICPYSSGRQTRTINSESIANRPWIRWIDMLRRRSFYDPQARSYLGLTGVRAYYPAPEYSHGIGYRLKIKAVSPIFGRTRTSTLNWGSTAYQDLHIVFPVQSHFCSIPSKCTSHALIKLA